MLVALADPRGRQSAVSLEVPGVGAGGPAGRERRTLGTAAEDAPDVAGAAAGASGDAAVFARLGPGRGSPPARLRGRGVCVLFRRIPHPLFSPPPHMAGLEGSLQPTPDPSPRPAGSVFTPDG